MQNDVSVFVLEMRSFEKNDISIECPFVPEIEDVDLSVQALTDNIENIEDVLEVVVKFYDNKVGFEIKTLLSLKELKDNMKVYLSDHICYLRFVNLFTQEVFGEIK